MWFKKIDNATGNRVRFRVTPTGTGASPTEFIGAVCCATCFDCPLSSLAIPFLLMNPESSDSNAKLPRPQGAATSITRERARAQMMTCSNWQRAKKEQDERFGSAEAYLARQKAPQTGPDDAVVASSMRQSNRKIFADSASEDTDAGPGAIAKGQAADCPRSGFPAAAERNAGPLLPSAIAYDTPSPDEPRIREQLQDPETARVDYLNYKRGSASRSNDDLLELGERREGVQGAIREGESASRSGKSPVDWARRCGLILDPSALIGVQELAPFKGGGMEHHVFLDEASGRIVKVSRGRFFGVHHPGSFEKYLERWALSNIEFGEESQFHGFVRLPGEHFYSVVVSDRFIEGREGREEPPDRAAIDEAMRRRGYRANGQGASYTHSKKRIRATDALAKNFVIIESGEAVPIDLGVERLEKPEEDANQLFLFAPERVTSTSSGPVVSSASTGSG